MEQKGERQQSTPRSRPSQRGSETQAGTRGADRALIGRSYEAGAVMRSLDGSRGVLEAPSEPRDEMTAQAEALHEAHGEQIAEGAARAGVSAEATAAVMLTESGGVPQVSDKEMAVRFEPFVFYQQTGKWLVATHKDQAAEQGVFQQAREIDPVAAHAALRMGIGQVSGGEAEAAGFEDAEQMYHAMQGSVQAQIDGLLGVISSNAELQQALGESDWQAVAELRAGPGYGALGFDEGLHVWSEVYREVSGQGYGGGDDDDEDKPKINKTPKKHARP